MQSSRKIPHQVTRPLLDCMFHAFPRHRLKGTEEQVPKVASSKVHACGPNNDLHAQAVAGTDSKMGKHTH